MDVLSLLRTKVMASNFSQKVSILLVPGITGKVVQQAIETDSFCHFSNILYICSLNMLMHFTNLLLEYSNLK